MEEVEANESFEVAKNRWDSMIGMPSVIEEGNRLIYRSPTGYPLAMIELNVGHLGYFTACHGHPIGLQNDWVNENCKRPGRWQ